MVKTTVSMAPVGPCQEHVVADGQVERSKKMDGVVERTRRCDLCGSLFKTFEMTEDQVGRQNGEHDLEIRDLRKELNYFKEIFGNVKAIVEAMETLKNDVLMEYEFGSGDRD